MTVRVSVLCSDAGHPVNPYLEQWAKDVGSSIDVEIIRRKKDASGGDILFLISCSEIITSSDRAKYGSCLVIHASDLPRGRGWSPHVWEIINGAEGITVSLLEAADMVDGGAVWKKEYLDIPKHAVWHEINDVLFKQEIELMSFAVKHHSNVKPVPQDEGRDLATYRKRTPEDSELDPHKTIAEQFDLMRVCDPERFPAFFNYRGHRYALRLEKQDA